MVEHVGPRASYFPILKDQEPKHKSSTVKIAFEWRLQTHSTGFTQPSRKSKIQLLKTLHNHIQVHNQLVFTINCERNFTNVQIKIHKTCFISFRFWLFFSIVVWNSSFFRIWNSLKSESEIAFYLFGFGWFGLVWSWVLIQFMLYYLIHGLGGGGVHKSNSKFDFLSWREVLWIVREWQLWNFRVFCWPFPS